MTKLLFIGSTVVDVIINIDHLPRTCEDVNVYGQELAMGGCAFNAYSMARRFGAPCQLFSPVGAGIYGDYVQAHLDREGIQVPIPRPEKENGCCYCCVEPGGERTFVSYHGAEYLFEKEWFDALDASEIGGAYFCGIEVEDPPGENIITFLEENPHITPYFAPGPRITRLQPERLRRILALHPVLHLNEEEAKSAAAMYGQSTDDSVEAAAAAGVDSVEHGAYLNEEVLCAMAQAGTVWVPTLSTIGNLRGKGRFSEVDVERILQSAQENVARFTAMGGLLAPGSDAGAWEVPHGIKTEYALLQQVLGENTRETLEKGIAVIQEKF